MHDLTLQIEPTRACNLNCSICIRPNIKNPHNFFLSFEDFKKICDTIISSRIFRYIGLHGWGEPLLNPELFKMVRYAEAKGLETNLTTNGILLNEKIGEIFASGLQQIAFGVYKASLLKKIIPAVMELIKTRDQTGLKIPKTYFDITIYKENLKYIQSFIETAHEIGVDAIILHRLFNVYKVDPSIEYISRSKEERLFKEVEDMVEENGMEIYFPVKHNYPCKVVKYSIFVTVDGEVTPCCFLPEYNLGNALKTGIIEILTSKSYQDFVKRMERHPICKRCNW